MHTYIYDSFVSHKKYVSIINQLETRLTDLGVSGRVCRLSKLRSLTDIVKQELRRNPKTLVVVGNDWIVHQVIGLMINFHIPLGVVPIGDEKDSKIAAGLGIDLKSAPQILSARRIIDMDIGEVNKKIFLRNIAFTTENVKIDINGDYTIRIGKANMEIINFLPDKEGYTGKNPNPEDGKLNLLINKRESGIFKKEESQSAICFKKIEIDGVYSEVNLDNVARASSLEQIGVMKKALKMIVGKDRCF
ncbi:MAG: diacylglycerol kinase family protein [bacterium]